MIYQRIRYFLAAAEKGSFSAAASQLYISPQALTKQIGLLEQELGGALFERSPQGVTLTRFGSYALEKLSALESKQIEIMEDLKRQAREQKERIRIGIFSSLPQDTIVSPVISFLLGAHQEYQFNLELVELDVGRRLLLEGKLDLLLTNTHEEDSWNGYRMLSFDSFPAEVIVSLLHPWAIKKQITTDDMKESTFLKMDMDMSLYKVPRNDSFYDNIPCKNKRVMKNFNTLYALLQQGDAFAVFPRAYAQMDTARVKYFEYPGKALTFYTAMLCRDKSDVPGWNELVENLKEEFDLVEIFPS